MFTFSASVVYLLFALWAMWGHRVWFYISTFTVARCRYCGRVGVVMRDDHLHEMCWLEWK